MTIKQHEVVGWLQKKTIMGYGISVVLIKGIKKINFAKFGGEGGCMRDRMKGTFKARIGCTSCILQLK